MYKNTVVVHSTDEQEVVVSHEVKSPENQPQFSLAGANGAVVSLNKLLDRFQKVVF